MKIVIAGGGTAGWAAAVALSKQLGPLLDIALVESDEIGTIGVGESTIPPMRSFHRLAGIDEAEFMRATSAVFKLGIQFENWRKDGDSYFHSFGQVGRGAWLADFQHIWLEAKARGFTDSLEDFCLELRAARANKFVQSEKVPMAYAYHLDATAYARYLRGICESRGVRRIEGKIQRVEQNADTGFIEKLVLENGTIVEGDLFIDCTGFRGLLIEQTLKTGYEDWSHWLPTDRAFAVQTKAIGKPVPYTVAMAHESGWQWRIPLQHRMGNGFVYCSEFMSDDEAKQRFQENLEGEALTEPRLLRFRTGRRLKAWNKNCIALGLSSGFLEPLESTSIFLMMIGVTRLIQHFPFSGITSSLVDRYNDLTKQELERIRDFVILHYKVTEREDTPFWRRCKNQEVPESLAERLKLFEESGHIYEVDIDIFQRASWLQVMFGQGLEPQTWHPFAKLLNDEELKKSLDRLSMNMKKAVEAMPAHHDFIERYCKANPS